MKELKVSINNKDIRLKGEFVGNLFCVYLSSIENHPLLSAGEKESLRREFLSNKNILIK